MSDTLSNEVKSETNISENTDQNTNTNTNKRELSENEKKEIMLLNWFTSSTISILNLLRESMRLTIDEGPFVDVVYDNKDKDDEQLPKKFYELELDDIELKQLEPSDLTETQKRNFDKFMKSSLTMINNLKKNDFDYGLLIKKGFKVLQSKESTNFLLDEDFSVFKQKDEDGKYMTIIKGVDIRFGCKFLTNSRDKALFWQYMNLFSVSIFRLIEFSNEKKMKKYSNVKMATLELEQRLSKSGLMFGDKFFNPFIGIHELGSKYSMDDLYQSVSKTEKMDGFGIGSILKMMGIDKILSSEKLKEELDKIGDEDIEKATNTISQLLGNDDEDSKEVYGTLIKDMITGLKKDGLDNPNKLIDRMMGSIDKKFSKEKMEKTMNSVSNFMDNSEDRLKELKDKDGNPVGEQIMDKMKGPMESLKGLKEEDLKNPMNLMKNLSGIMKSFGINKNMKNMMK